MEKLSATTNALNWFEIPMTDVARAKKFYETILDIEMHEMKMMDMHMVMFPTQAPHSGGALAKSQFHVPSNEGALIYLNGNPNLQTILDKVDGAGGIITMLKTQISPEIGFMAFIQDSEGNTIGIHSSK